jgi:hypothetical protein
LRRCTTTFPKTRLGEIIRSSSCPRGGRALVLDTCGTARRSHENAGAHRRRAKNLVRVGKTQNLAARA